MSLTDGGGLYLEVTTKGSKRWRLKYRLSGVEKLISLGLYPEITLKDARERCSEARKLLANGVNPSETRKAQKAAVFSNAANRFETVAREWSVNLRSFGTWARHRKGWKIPKEFPYEFISPSMIPVKCI